MLPDEASNGCRVVMVYCMQVDSLDLDGFSSGSGAPAAAATSPCTRKPHRAAWAACYRAMRGVWSVVKVRPLVAVIPTLLLAGELNPAQASSRKPGIIFSCGHMQTQTGARVLHVAFHTAMLAHRRM